MFIDKYVHYYPKKSVPSIWRATLKNDKCNGHFHRKLETWLKTWTKMFVFNFSLVSLAKAKHHLFLP